MTAILAAADHPDYQQALGERLRRIRHQQGLSLADVETRSEGRWKAVVVGAYERGDRAVSIERLQRLAAFYEVPLSELLPTTRRPIVDDDGPTRVVVDLTVLARPPTPRLAVLVRYAHRVRRLRGDHNGRIMSMRGRDLDTLAIALGTTTDDLVGELRARGALLEHG